MRLFTCPLDHSRAGVSSRTRLRSPRPAIRDFPGRSMTGLVSPARDFPGRSMTGLASPAGPRTRPVDRELHQLPAPEEPLPVVVPLALRHDQADGVPGTVGSILGDERGGVLVQGDDLVLVAVDKQRR